MIIKKISLKFKSGYLTPLESDTILGYVFAKNFSELESVFNKFEGGNIPFLLSNGFINGKICRPIVFSDDTHSKSSLWDDLKYEKSKKLLKSLNFIPLKKEVLQVIFEDTNKMSDILEEASKSDVEIESVSSEMKNSIPRFNQGETVPFAVENIKYPTAEHNIYVKVYDEVDFDKFFNLMQKTLLSIGWGKGISRGYGKLSQCELMDLSIDEKEAFDYIDKIKSESHKVIVLNNYKPSDTELDIIDLGNSYLQIINKNTKSGDNYTFKGNMKFIAPGSVIVANGDLKGSYYQVGKSFNFGYLF